MTLIEGIKELKLNKNQVLIRDGFSGRPLDNPNMLYLDEYDNLRCRDKDDTSYPVFNYNDLISDEWHVSNKRMQYSYL